MTTQGTLYIYRGDTPTLEVPVVNRDGDPVVLDTFALRFTAKRNEWDADEDAIIVKTLNDYGEDGIELGGETGLALVHIDADDTSGLTKRTTLHWDFQTTEDDGTITTVASGLMVVRADISQTVP